MFPAFVFLHSPLLGPRSWQPVATELEAAGHQVAVPSLLGIAHGEPPFWSHVLDTVGEQLRVTDPGRPVILVPHSNAGFFVPLLGTELDAEVRGCIYVDAALPGRSGETPVAPAGALPFLREAAKDGLLPPWTEWWDDEEVRGLFPDEATRQAVAAEQPQLPLAYFEQSVPVPARWDEQPCAYVQFSSPYDEDAAHARERGWMVEHLSGGHLHMLADPTGVTRLLTTVAKRAGMSSP